MGHCLPLIEAGWRRLLEARKELGKLKTADGKVRGGKEQGRRKDSRALLVTHPWVPLGFPLLQTLCLLMPACAWDP